MVCLTYVELYNNNLNDLLVQGPSSSGENSSSSLKIHEHPKQGIYLSGSPGIRTPVSSAREALELIDKGNRIRAVNATNLNERSSRSHTVISFEIPNHSYRLRRLSGGLFRYLFPFLIIMNS